MYFWPHPLAIGVRSITLPKLPASRPHNVFLATPFGNWCAVNYIAETAGEQTTQCISGHTLWQLVCGQLHCRNCRRADHTMYFWPHPLAIGVRSITLPKLPESGPHNVFLATPF